MSNPDIGRGMASALRAENNMLKRKVENSITEVTTENEDELQKYERPIKELDENFIMIRNDKFQNLDYFRLFTSNIMGDGNIYIKVPGKKINTISLMNMASEEMLGGNYRFSDKVKIIEVEVRENMIEDMFGQMRPYD